MVSVTFTETVGHAWAVNMFLYESLINLGHMSPMFVSVHILANWH